MDGPAGGSELDGWRRPQTPAGLQLRSGPPGTLSTLHTPMHFGDGGGGGEHGVWSYRRRQSRPPVQRVLRPHPGTPYRGAQGK